MAKQDSTLRTFTVIGLLCFICALLVCSAVVLLQPIQQKSMNVDREKSILAAAGISYEKGDVSKIYADNIEARLLDLATGKFVTDKKALQDITHDAQGKPDGYNFVSEAKIASSSVAIPADKDTAGIRARAKYMPVYLVKSGKSYTSIILPFYGQGLWSTMYAYLSVSTDGETIQGVKYYSHGETPGLGAEVENPNWTKKWIGKQLFGKDGSVLFKVLKNVDDPAHQVDALSGATLTSNGVSKSVAYWVGDHAYGPFLAKVKKEGIK